MSRSKGEQLDLSDLIFITKKMGNLQEEQVRSLYDEDTDLDCYNLDHLHTILTSLKSLQKKFGILINLSSEMAHAREMLSSRGEENEED